MPVKLCACHALADRVRAVFGLMCHFLLTLLTVQCMAQFTRHFTSLYTCLILPARFENVAYQNASGLIVET